MLSQNNFSVIELLNIFYTLNFKLNYRVNQACPKLRSRAKCFLSIVEWDREKTKRI